MLVAPLAVQLNLMVLRHNTEFRLAPLRSVEQVNGLKNKTKQMLQGKIQMFVLKDPEIS